MSNRLDQEREKNLEPLRLKKALNEIGKLARVIGYNDKAIVFEFNGSECTYYAYSGWATGKTIKDGRGLDNLLNQLKV